MLVFIKYFIFCEYWHNSFKMLVTEVCAFEVSFQASNSVKSILVFGRHFHNRLHHMWIKMCLFWSFWWRIVSRSEVLGLEFTKRSLNMYMVPQYSIPFLEYLFLSSMIWLSLITDGLSTMAFSNCILNYKISLDNVSWS